MRRPVHEPGLGDEPLVEHDILEPSEAMRHGLEYYSHGKDTQLILRRIAATHPTTLACMHGSAWHGDGAALLLELGRRLAAACWLKQKTSFGKLESDLADSFAPESPSEWKKNPNEWLSSTDLIKVMKQYEKAYKCFDFIGPTPIDFDTRQLYGECVWEELCKFNLEKLIKKGKTKIGVIFNTDLHNKPGQHWISLFINIKKKQIFFFDSAGDPIPKQVQKFVDNVIQQGRKLPEKIEFHFDENYPVEHQYGNTECGVYSLYFIVHMLEDKIATI